MKCNGFNRHTVPELRLVLKASNIPKISKLKRHELCQLIIKHKIVPKPRSPSPQIRSWSQEKQKEKESEIVAFPPKHRRVRNAINAAFREDEEEEMRKAKEQQEKKSRVSATPRKDSRGDSAWSTYNSVMFSAAQLRRCGKTWRR